MLNLFILCIRGSQSYTDWQDGQYHLGHTFFYLCYQKILGPAASLPMQPNIENKVLPIGHLQKFLTHYHAEMALLRVYYDGNIAKSNSQLSSRILSELASKFFSKYFLNRKILSIFFIWFIWYNIYFWFSSVTALSYSVSFKG